MNPAGHERPANNETMEDQTFHTDLPEALVRRLRDLDPPPPPDFSAVDAAINAEIEAAYEKRRSGRMRLYWAVPAAGAALAALLVAGVMTFTTFLDGGTPPQAGGGGVASVQPGGPTGAGQPEPADAGIDFSRYDFAQTDVDGEDGVNIRDVQIMMLADRAGAAEVSETSLTLARAQAVSLGRFASRDAASDVSRAAMAVAARQGVEQLNRLRSWVGLTAEGVIG